MPTIFPTVLDVIGRTPMVRLNRLSVRPDVEVIVKLDYLNPGGSTKDRPLARMVEEAEINGDLKPGSTIVDSSSGNFAVAMAMAGAVRGYPVICVVDPKLTEVIKSMLIALGAELVYATEADHTGSYLRNRLAVRDELVKATLNAWCPDQYRNKASVRSHYYGTGAEVVEAVEGRLDALVVATGTGGTISGCARMVKKHLPGVHIVAADAVGSKIFDDEVYKWLQKGVGSGLGASELDNVDLSMIDEVRLVGDQEAFMTARALVRNEGILAGGSAGCAVFAALTVSLDLPAGSRVATILPDRLERYLFEHPTDAWMQDHGLALDHSPEALAEAVQTWCGGSIVVEGSAGLPVRKWHQKMHAAQPALEQV